MLSGGPPGPHKIQGIGAGFVPEILNTKIIDDIVQARTRSRPRARWPGSKAFRAASAWAATWRRRKNRPDMAGKFIVVVFPSSAERYRTTLVEGL